MGGPAASIDGGSLRFEAMDQILEVIDEVRVIEVRLVTGERDDLSVAFCRLLMVAFGLAEPAKTLIAVMHGGEAYQYFMGGLLGLVEFPGVNEGEHRIGRGIQLFIAVIAQVRIKLRGVGRGLRRRGSELLVRDRLVAVHAAALVFLAAAARAEIIPSDFGHLANVSSKDGSLVPSRAGRRQIP